MGLKRVWIVQCDNCGKLERYRCGFNSKDVRAGALLEGWMRVREGRKQIDLCNRCYSNRPKARGVK